MSRMQAAQEHFDSLTPEFLALPDVKVGRMFGTTGLGVRGKIFAFVGTDGDLIAKVGGPRANELVAEGVAVLKVMRDRAMKEWVSVDFADAPTWRDIIAEAHDYLDEITP